MKMETSVTVQRSVAVVLGLVVIIALLLMAWIGSELHYNNCLTKEQLAGKNGSACSHFP
jgi:hypothetical protein